MGKETFTDPINQVNKYFDVLIADTQAQKTLGYQFRYEVFCKEFQFEKEQDCPNQQEKDMYDDGACHCFILNKRTQNILGTIRLILPLLHQPKVKLPFEQFINLNSVPDLEAVKFGEASRLAVHQDMRRRRFDGSNVSGTNAEVLVKEGFIPDRNYPLVALTMMLSGAALGRLNHLDYLFAMMEPKLNMVLSHYGIFFNQVGDLTNYHGERAPFMVEPCAIWDTINPELKPLLDYLYNILGEKGVLQQIA